MQTSIRTTDAHLSRARKAAHKGFTLVEILIVVIILGILAAIVIPQFADASGNARNSSAKSLLQTVRSQVELYRMQHGDQYPTADGAVDSAWDWTKLTGTSTYGGNTYGPYLQQTPLNPYTQSATVVNDETSFTAANGYVVTTDGKIYMGYIDGTDTLFVGK